jgi:Lrp/AsnC family transcriptional regulator, leucine-responsive regulatory protein
MQNNVLPELDSTDRAIVATLQRDGRVTNIELAEAVHLSPSACLRRVKRLDELGVIDQFTMLVNRRAIGKGTDVFVEITLTSQREDLLDEFEQAVELLPDVLSCHLMSGDADYLVRVAVGDVADFERLHREHLAQLPGVARLRSSFALRKVCERTELEL